MKSIREKVRPYKVIGATLKYYDGHSVYVDILDREIRTSPIKITEELLLDSFCQIGLKNPPVGIKAKIKYV